MQESSARLAALAEIVEASRSLAGVPPILVGNIRRNAEDWSEICSEIPDARIREAYVEALRGREAKGLLQPGELNAAYKRLRDADRTKRARDAEHLERIASPDVCYYCEGTGWQTAAYIAESGNENTGVRACACSAAPVGFRKLAPLQAPEWQKRKHSVIWEKVVDDERFD